MTDLEMREIQADNARWMAHKSFVAIVEDGGQFVIVQHVEDGSSFPHTRYPNRRAAASRVLQLLGIGPVAPQIHPEKICVSWDREGSSE